MPPRRNHWTINGDFVGFKQTGVARYAREVTAALDALVGEGAASDMEIGLVAPRAADGLGLAHIPVRVVPEFKPRLPQVWVQMQLPRFAPGGLVSLCNLAPVGKRRHIACIHDLHTFLMPESYGRGFRLAHRAILPAVGRAAFRITTVSELSKSHLIEQGVARADKIVVAYNGADHAARWRPERAGVALGPRPFALCLAQRQKYKNIALIWRIAPALDDAGLDVYVAGDFDAAAVAALGEPTARNIRLLGRISDDDLAAALRAARCLLFPSRIEGFGLPMVEAMMHGCPVVASTSPCLPEVSGGAALHVDPDDAAGWVSAVSRLHEDETLRRDLAEKGRVRAAQFTWRGVAETYLRLMREADAAL
ncbi:MAG: glycosyltransferase family 1 protein [Hyphomicrobiales bacterium]|nr:glycosyltransferase family 1 protein [Hyphomicrobiales bacterium]